MKNWLDKRVGFLQIPITRIILLVAMDLLGILLSAMLSLYVRYDFRFMDIPRHFWDGALTAYLLNAPLTLLIFYIFRLYNSVWRYASDTELVNTLLAAGCSTLCQPLVFWILGIRVPYSFPFFYGFFLLAWTGGIRFGYRLLRMLQNRRREVFRHKDRENAMIVGAGAAGNAILREIESSRYLQLHVACVIDDNPGCHGKYLRGVPIVGAREQIPEMVEKYSIHEIIVAMPSASRSMLRPILEICKETGCRLRLLPGMYQLIKGDVCVSQLREVQIEDLLGRDPVRVNNQEILAYVEGKTVLVTGGGGSIGSELCRQISQHRPARLVILDIYENNAYEIQQELLAKHPDMDLVVLIGSVRNTARVEEIFSRYKPEIVYHAAAHKHVPLMEDSPGEAVKNNVFGTWKVAQAADRHGVRRFVLISTDKAVNPTNIMGASKRICEMIIQDWNRKSATEYVAVRFGNVLGSNGSVVPLFKKQIEQGGPVRVTHPDILRYFMTIPEAVSLVLQAGAYAKGGEIFVLDMGEPVKIADLARNLIKLSGYKPDEDIAIEFTGLRPGEKMFEELLLEEEGMRQTANSRIRIGRPLEFDHSRFVEQLEELRLLSEQEDENIRVKVREIVPGYQPEVGDGL